MKKILFFFLFIATGACVEPYTLRSSDVLEAIVVDGMITNEPGPYRVRLYYTKPVDAQQRKIVFLSQADVTISDNAGNSELLTETSPGNYYTSTITGVVGNTYTLSIVTPAGDHYESTPEELLPIGPMADLKYKFEINENPVFHPYITTNGFQVIVNAKILPEQQKRIRWRWAGTFELNTHPELILKPTQQVEGDTTRYESNPPTCSGYEKVGKKGIRRVGDCTCCRCYVTQYNTIPLLTDTLSVIDSIRNYSIMFVNGNERIFHTKYHLEVEQLSVSRTTYGFWEAIRKQQQTGSELFQTPPSPTRGNIHATSDNALPILGVFSASSIERKILELTKADFPYGEGRVDTMRRKCEYVYIGSTSYQKPVFY